MRRFRIKDMKPYYQEHPALGRIVSAMCFVMLIGAVTISPALALWDARADWLKDLGRAGVAMKDMLRIAFLPHDHS
jgi:hypothetical protein